MVLCGTFNVTLAQMYIILCTKKNSVYTSIKVFKAKYQIPKTRKSIEDDFDLTSEFVVLNIFQTGS